MSAGPIRQCGTVCEAFYFDPSYSVSVEAKRDEEEIVAREVTDEHRQFARRGEDHFAVAMFMGQLTRSRLITIAVSIRMDLTGEHLPYPANYVCAKLRALPVEDRDEAWELFGDGVEP